jgi:hypothetical protein
VLAAPLAAYALADWVVMIWQGWMGMPITVIS